MSLNQQELSSNPEKEQQAAVVELIAPQGLGFGEGGITVKKQIEEGILTPETPRHIHEMLTNDHKAFKPVEVDDDGCGDGRPWVKIIQEYLDENGDTKIRLFGKSKLRAKVFGGGLVVASSMWRTIQGEPAEYETVGHDRAFMAEKLRDHHVNHGAHSDDHAEGENCGCGAIDKYTLISANALKYREQITDTLAALYGDDLADNTAAIEQAFGTYEALARREGYFKDASGKQSMEQILSSGAVVKELAGHHIEETIVINDVEGTTLDQQYFTETIKNADPAQKPRIVQAFSVDVWRGRKLAEVVAEVAKEQDPTVDVEAIKKLAYADFLIRTLAVAATLTAGDLPVYRRSTSQDQA